MLFRPPVLDSTERRIGIEVDRLRGDLQHLTAPATQWSGLLRRNALARAVQGSNSIEGYHVTLEDALAAVEGEEPSIDPNDATWLAVAGYRLALTFVLQQAEEPRFRYSEELLQSLHFMMMAWDRSKRPGRFRPGSIFVRNDETGQIVYEGPPAEQVQPLLAALLEDLNRQDEEPVLIRAAMSHLNLVMIHPFSDGNGRMARGLQTLVLARGGVVAPQFASIEEYLGRHTEAYYSVLAEVGGGSWQPGRDTRPWIRFCLRAHYHQALTLLRRSREMNRLWDAVEDMVGRRGLAERMVAPLVDAAFGRSLRNATYRGSADVSDVVAGRDLKSLADQGLLERQGANRGRTYVAAEMLLDLRRRTAEPRVPLPDPFAEPQ